eukprot:2574630-Pleurochrysis_carterae.AAC.1
MKSHPLTSYLIMALVVFTSSQPSFYARIKGIGHAITNTCINAFKARIARMAELRHHMPHGCGRHQYGAPLRPWRYE